MKFFCKTIKIFYKENPTVKKNITQLHRRGGDFRRSFENSFTNIIVLELLFCNDGTKNGRCIEFCGGPGRILKYRKIKATLFDKGTKL
jgi:hypothetical protein